LFEKGSGGKRQKAKGKRQKAKGAGVGVGVGAAAGVVAVEDPNAEEVSRRNQIAKAKQRTKLTQSTSIQSNPMK
jgi:hypothetical protein